MKLNTNVQTQAHIFLLTVYKFSLLFALRQQNVVILLSCFSWDVLATHHSFRPILLLFWSLIQQPGVGLSCPLSVMPACTAAEDKAVTAELEGKGDSCITLLLGCFCYTWHTRGNLWMVHIKFLSYCCLVASGEDGRVHLQWVWIVRDNKWHHWLWQCWLTF